MLGQDSLASPIENPKKYFKNLGRILFVEFNLTRVGLNACGVGNYDREGVCKVLTH